MKKSKGLFYAGIAGIVVVLVIAVVVIVMSRHSGGGKAATGGGTVTITCYGGSEKADFINDPDVKKILREKYGLEVNFIAKGSYKQVQIPADELKKDKVDCLWPSSASAQAVFEGSGSSKAFGNDYQAASVLQSPEVLYANKEAAEGLKNAGIVQVRDNSYFIVDLRRLLEEYLLPGKSWADLGVAIPTINAALPWIAQATALVSPQELGGLVQELTPAVQNTASTVNLRTARAPPVPLGIAVETKIVSRGKAAFISSLRCLIKPGSVWAGANTPFHSQVSNPGRTSAMPWMPGSTSIGPGPVCAMQVTSLEERSAIVPGTLLNCSGMRLAKRSFRTEPISLYGT